MLSLRSIDVSGIIIAATKIYPRVANIKLSPKGELALITSVTQYKPCLGDIPYPQVAPKRPTKAESKI